MPQIHISQVAHRALKMQAARQGLTLSETLDVLFASVAWIYPVGAVAEPEGSEAARNGLAAECVGDGQHPSKRESRSPRTAAAAPAVSRASREDDGGSGAGTGCEALPPAYDPASPVVAGSPPVPEASSGGSHAEVAPEKDSPVAPVAEASVVTPKRRPVRGQTATPIGTNAFGDDIFED